MKQFLSNAIIPLVVATIVVSALVFTGVVHADRDHENDHDENNNEWNKCVSTGAQCGTDNGTKTETKDRPSNMVCPSGYNPEEHGDKCNKEVTETVTRYADKIRHDRRSECPDNDSAYTSTTEKECSRTFQQTHKVETDKIKQYGNCGEGWTVNPSNESQCQKTESCHTGKIDNSACVTPVPTQPGNGFGLPGDGRSDGRSDGKSSCPECTAPPKTGAVLGATTQGQVLGASTDFAGTGSAVEMLMNTIGSVGAFLTTAGVAFIAKKK
jgi:hypothetical protein